MTLIKIKKTFNSQLRNQHFLILKKKKEKKKEINTFLKKKTFEINIYCFFKNGKQIMSIPLIF